MVRYAVAAALVWGCRGRPRAGLENNPIRSVTDAAVRDCALGSGLTAQLFFPPWDDAARNDTAPGDAAACAAAPSLEVPVFYSRVPKTGSTTMRRIIFEATNATAAAVPGEPSPMLGKPAAHPSLAIYREKEAVPLLAALSRRTHALYTPHTAFGLHSVARTPCCYLAVLRHPFERMLSAYYEYHASSGILGFLGMCDGAFAFHNQQTLQLCGSDPRCADPRFALDIALAHADRCYTAGVLEHSEDTMRLFKERYPLLFGDADLAAAPVLRKTNHLARETKDTRAKVEGLRGGYGAIAWADLALWEFVKARQEARPTFAPDPST